MAASPNSSLPDSGIHSLWPLQATAWAASMAAGACGGAALAGGGAAWLWWPGSLLLAVSLIAVVAMLRRIGRAIGEIDRFVLALADGRLIDCGEVIEMAQSTEPAQSAAALI